MAGRPLRLAATTLICMPAWRLTVLNAPHKVAATLRLTPAVPDSCSSETIIHIQRSFVYETRLQVVFAPLNLRARSSFRASPNPQRAGRLQGNHAEERSPCDHCRRSFGAR